VKLTDPTGAIINRITSFDTQNSDKNKQIVMGPNLLMVPLPSGKELEGRMENFGCLFTAMVNIGNTIRHQTPNSSSATGDPARPVSDYAGNQDYYAPDSVAFQNAPGLLKSMTGKDFSVYRLKDNREASQQMIQFYNESTISGAYIIAEVDGPYGSHFLNLLGVDLDGKLQFHDPLGGNAEYKLTDVKGVFIIQEKYHDPINR
jgi:hypothetical protein